MKIKNIRTATGLNAMREEHLSNLNQIRAHLDPASSSFAGAFSGPAPLGGFEIHLFGTSSRALRVRPNTPLADAIVSAILAEISAIEAQLADLGVECEERAA